MIKKVRSKFTVMELKTLDHLLALAHAYVLDDPGSEDTIAQIIRLREKIHQMILQQRKIR